MDNSKPFYKSKTLWFNLLAGAGAMFVPGGAFEHVLGPTEVGLIMGIGNALLRFVTDKGLVH